MYLGEAKMSQTSGFCSGKQDQGLGFSVFILEGVKHGTPKCLRPNRLLLLIEIDISLEVREYVFD